MEVVYGKIDQSSMDFTHSFLQLYFDYSTKKKPCYRKQNAVMNNKVPEPFDEN